MIRRLPSSHGWTGALVLPDIFVNAELRKIIADAYRSVWEVVRRERVTFREAAFLVGVGRVHHVAKLRGFV